MGGWEVVAASEAFLWEGREGRRVEAGEVETRVVAVEVGLSGGEEKVVAEMEVVGTEEEALEGVVQEAEAVAVAAKVEVVTVAAE